MAITNYSWWGQFSWAVSNKKKESQGFESSLTQSCSVESDLHSIDSTFLLHSDKNFNVTSAIGFSREWKLKEKLFNVWGQFRLY